MASTNNGLTPEVRRNSAIDADNELRKDEGISIHLEDAPKFQNKDELPKAEEMIEALGIPDWRRLEKKPVRRLDMIIVPMLWIHYVTNYLDRASIGQARLSTLDEDRELDRYMFGNDVSILSAGYILAQIPFNMLIPYIRSSLYLGGCAIVWSGVAASTAGVPNYRALLAVRFMLDLVEASLFPGAVYCLSCCYSRNEPAMRMACMATGVPIANGLSGFIGAAIFSRLDGKYGVAGWQWFFIVVAICGGSFGLLAMSHLYLCEPG